MVGVKRAAAAGKRPSSTSSSSSRLNSAAKTDAGSKRARLTSSKQAGGSARRGATNVQENASTINEKGLTNVSFRLGANKLLKSEPDEYGWEHLNRESNKTGFWDGVRNHQAKNVLKRMKVGDEAFFYHSSCKVPGIVGTVKIASEAEPDPSALDPSHKYFDAKSDPSNPTWVGLRVTAVQELPRIVTLTELKSHKDGALAQMILLKFSRLSCQPVSQEEWDFVMDLASTLKP